MSTIIEIIGYAAICVGGSAILGALLWLTAKIYIATCDLWITVYKGTKEMFMWSAQKKQFREWLVEKEEKP